MSEEHNNRPVRKRRSTRGNNNDTAHNIQQPQGVRGRIPNDRQPDEIIETTYSQEAPSDHAGNTRRGSEANTGRSGESVDVPDDSYSDGASQSDTIHNDVAGDNGGSGYSDSDDSTGSDRNDNYNSNRNSADSTVGGGVSDDEGGAMTSNTAKAPSGGVGDTGRRRSTRGGTNSGVDGQNGIRSNTGVRGMSGDADVDADGIGRSDTLGEDPEQDDDLNRRADGSEDDKQTDGTSKDKSDDPDNKNADGSDKDDSKSDSDKENDKNESEDEDSDDKSDDDAPTGAKAALDRYRNTKDKIPGAGKSKRNKKGKDDDDDSLANVAKEGAMDVAKDAAKTSMKGIMLKVAGYGGAGAGAASLLVAGMMLMAKFGAMIKAATVGFLAKIGGAISTAFSAVTSWIGSAFGVGVAAAKPIAIGAIATVTTATTIGGYGAITELNKRDEMAAGIDNCVPITTKAPEAAEKHADTGEVAAMKEADAIRLWSVYSELGGAKQQAAAVMGNFEIESALDPTSVETIGAAEPYTIGPRDQHAIDVDFDIKQIDPAYAARFPAIDRAGIGLGQWTNGRNKLLVDFAKENDMPWYEFDTQMMFMISGDEQYRQDQLMEFITKDNPGNVDQETTIFNEGWIGQPPGGGDIESRKKHAQDYMFILERAEVDKDFAKSILDGVNVERSKNNEATGAFEKDDGCGEVVGDHYASSTPDGTGELPPGLTGIAWKHTAVPEAVEEFAKDPRAAGLEFGGPGGWAPGQWYDQCVALTHSLFTLIYPDWNKDGRPTTTPPGDGWSNAKGWADNYGESTQDYPQAGAVFSEDNGSVYGHTGIVQHVFANGDILIVEQNVVGASGEMIGQSYTWNFRVLSKETASPKNGYVFFKPKGYEPQWNGASGSKDED